MLITLLINKRLVFEKNLSSKRLKCCTENTIIGIAETRLGWDNDAILWSFDSDKYQALKCDRVNDERKMGGGVPLLVPKNKNKVQISKKE